jgi:hypothetical protein
VGSGGVDLTQKWEEEAPEASFTIRFRIFLIISVSRLSFCICLSN